MQLHAVKCNLNFGISKLKFLCGSKSTSTSGQLIGSNMSRTYHRHNTSHHQVSSRKRGWHEESLSLQWNDFFLLDSNGLTHSLQNSGLSSESEACCHGSCRETFETLEDFTKFT